jgi:hypothetical protein
VAIVRGRLYSKIKTQEGLYKMKKLALLVLLVSVALLSTRPVFAQDARAQALIKEARVAIGGEELLQKIQSLGINGQYRRMLGEREMAGDREVSIALPDKYLAEDAVSMGGMSTSMISTRGLNGEHAWNGQSGGGGGMFIRMNGPGGQQATPEQMEAMFRRQYSLEFTRYLLAILVTPPPSLAVEYKYVGESDVEDAHAEVIEVTGPDKLAVRLFFDKQTHMPLLLSYRGVKPRIMTMVRNSADKGTKPEEAIKKAQDDAQKKMTAEPTAKPEEVDFFIRLTEYKKVGGVLLPHKLTFLTEADVSEEFQVTKYQLNPQFKSDKFQKH